MHSAEHIEPPFAFGPSVGPRWAISGAYEPPEGRKERPTPHYSVERHLNLNGRDTSLIWTYSQVGRKCCFLWWPRRAFPTAENTSGRRRSAFGAPSGRRRAAVGQPSGRRRAAVGPPSDRRRSAVEPCILISICVYVKAAQHTCIYTANYLLTHGLSL